MWAAVMRLEESGGELRMASVFLSEMVSKAQNCLKSMAQHVDSIIAERRSVRQSVKSLETSVAACTKDSGQQSSRRQRDLLVNVTAVQTSVEKLTESSSIVLQVDQDEDSPCVASNGRNLPPGRPRA